jgi:hypothetical protein
MHVLSIVIVFNMPLIMDLLTKQTPKHLSAFLKIDLALIGHPSTSRRKCIRLQTGGWGGWRKTQKLQQKSLMLKDYYCIMCIVVLSSMYIISQCLLQG